MVWHKATAACSRARQRRGRSSGESQGLAHVQAVRQARHVPASNGLLMLAKPLLMLKRRTTFPVCSFLTKLLRVCRAFLPILSVARCC